MKKVECPKCGEVGNADSECPGCGLLLNGTEAEQSLVGLNGHLFAQLERLSDKSLSGEKLKDEIERSRAVASISKEIVSGAKLQLDAVRAIKEHGLDKAPAIIAIEHQA